MYIYIYIYILIDKFGQGYWVLDKQLNNRFAKNTKYSGKMGGGLEEEKGTRQ
jgi:hypothetical protein